MVVNTVTVFRVLVVDDDPADVQLIKAALGEGAFTCDVITAACGVEAMEYLRGKDNPAPDLVLLDLNMPRMNGKDVLRAMKAEPALAQIPVVVLTTSQMERDMVVSYGLGASGFVTKPMDMEELFSIIHSIEEYWFKTVSMPGRNI